MAAMPKHKNDSGFSVDVMGHLELVLLNRLDLSKRLTDKLDVKISTFTSKSLKLSSNLSSLTDQFSPFHKAGRLVTRYAELGALMAEDIKDHQKMLFDHAISLGSLRSPCSSNALFELFTCVECFIEYCDEIEQLQDKFEKAINVMLSINMNVVSSLEGNDMNSRVMMGNARVMSRMRQQMVIKTDKMKEETMTLLMAWKTSST